MIAWVLKGQELQKTQTQKPKLKKSSVRIQVFSIGINRADLLQKMGRYPAPVGVRQDILGLECSGIVIECGADVHPDILNRRVMALLSGEAYAEEVVVHIDSILLIPESLSMNQAAAIPEAFLTAYDSLWVQCGVQEGHNVLVHAIASGVGDAARQLCQVHNINVFGTSRSLDKVQWGNNNGCCTVQIENNIFPKDLPNMDIIVDFVGANYFQENLRILNKLGQLQIVGLLGGIQTSIPLHILLEKRLTIRGTTLRNRSIYEKSTLISEFKHHILPLFNNGTLSPTIDSVYQWSDLEEAHERMRLNLNRGKIVLQVKED